MAQVLLSYFYHSLILFSICSTILSVHNFPENLLYNKDDSIIFVRRFDRSASSSSVVPSSLSTLSQTRNNQARIDQSSSPSRLRRINVNHEKHQTNPPSRQRLSRYASSSSGTERNSRRDKVGNPSSSSDVESESNSQGGGKPTLNRQRLIKIPSGSKSSENSNLIEEGISEKMRNLMDLNRLGKQRKVGGKRVVRYKNSSINYQDSGKKKESKEIDQEKYSTLSTFSPTIRSSLFPDKKNSNRSNSQKSKKKSSNLSRKFDKIDVTIDHSFSSSDQSPKKKHKVLGTSSDSSTDSDYVQRPRGQRKGFPDTRASSSSTNRNKKGPTWNLQNLDEKSKLGKSSLNIQSSSPRPKQRGSSIFFLSDKDDNIRSSHSPSSSSSVSR